MKKYKLIKEYPGSPRLGTELTPKVDKEDTDTNNFYWEGSWFNPNNYPEFWEEIIEKDYEILEIQGKYGSISSYKEQYDSDLKDKSIYKIKRLSDDEIFTIDDIVIGNSNIKYNISSFVINGRFGKIIINGHDIHLNECTKVKQPLFTTEDCVDIFDGNEFYFIAQNFSGNTCGKLKAKLGVLAEFSEARFSTKEKAEEYILMNKPCLSFQDIINTKIYAPLFMEDIKKLVKQKLNK